MADEYGGSDGGGQGGFGSWNSLAWSPDSWQPPSWEQDPSGGGYQNPASGGAPNWSSYNPQQPPAAPNQIPISTEQHRTRFLEGSGGQSVPAWAAAGAERQATPGPSYWPGRNDNPQLRDAEHSLFADAMFSSPLMTWPGTALSAGYSGAKWAAQNLPGGRFVDAISPVPLYNATKPSWQEVMWGLPPHVRALFGY